MPWFRDLFVSGTDTSATQPGVTFRGGISDEGNGEFITPQTLTTFAGATFAISLISGVLLRLFPAWSDVWVGAAVALAVGLFLLWINLTDPRVRRRLRSSRDWSIAIVVGLVNCVYLIAISIGVFEAIEAVATGT